MANLINPRKIHVFRMLIKGGNKLNKIKACIVVMTFSHYNTCFIFLKQTITYDSEELPELSINPQVYQYRLFLVV